MIKDHDISQLPVMKDEEVIGTISENSILQYILENPMKNADKAVSEIMSEPMPRVSMDLPLGMLNKCFTEKIPGVITRDQSNQYHVLTKYDIIRAL
ncbi:MAG: CBS domain-containing protein [Saprospiraceae bacterium]